MYTKARLGGIAMKILILGAGALGSLMADEFLRAGHEVTLLARGGRYQELKAHGLVVRHYLQFYTSRTRPAVVDTPSEGTVYDAAFCVLQYTQLHDALETLAKAKAGLYVLVGNNPAPEETRGRFRECGGQAQNLLFAFLGAGGRRENARAVSIHRRSVSLTAGALSGADAQKEALQNLLSGTNIQLYWETDISAWLIYHLAIVVPVARGIYAKGGNLHALAGDKAMLRTLILAVREAIEALKRMGVRHEATERALETPDQKLMRVLGILLHTPLGRLMAGDHAMSAKGEMAALGTALDARLGGAPEGTPLESYLSLKRFQPEA